MKIRKFLDRVNGEDSEHTEYLSNSVARVCCSTSIYYIRNHCRRHAPIPFVAAQALRIDVKHTIGVWPVTLYDDLCGEWAAEWHIKTESDKCE